MSKVKRPVCVVCVCAHAWRHPCARAHRGEEAAVDREGGGAQRATEKRSIAPYKKGLAWFFFLYANRLSATMCNHMLGIFSACQSGGSAVLWWVRCEK